MNITLNNINNPMPVICLTGNHNILKITDSTGGTKSTITLTVGQITNTTTDGEYYISINGGQIMSVTNPNNAKGRNFYVISSSPSSTAMSIARALRNTPNVSSYYNVECENTNTVTLTAMKYGNITATTDTNITALTISQTTGTSTTELENGKVSVDIYSGNNYITTLEKNYYNGEVAFEISNVLSTLTNYGDISNWKANIYAIYQNGNYANLGNKSGYTSYGYSVNGSLDYLYLNGITVAQYMTKGNSNSGKYNSSLLYIYQPLINISLYSDTLTSKTITIEYIDSANNLLYGTEETITFTNNLQDFEAILDSTYFNRAFYIDITIPTVGTVRYNVIKPLKATDTNQRVFWRNEYGGVSFFDFTGQYEDKRTISVTTYEQNEFDYYEQDIKQRQHIYDNGSYLQTTLTSHLVSKDGTYIFNSLAKSNKVWTVKDGNKYEIVLDSVDVNEQSVDNVFLCNIKYHNSINEIL